MLVSIRRTDPAAPGRKLNEENPTMKAYVTRPAMAEIESELMQLLSEYEDSDRQDTELRHAIKVQKRLLATAQAECARVIANVSAQDDS